MQPNNISNLLATASVVAASFAIFHFAWRIRLALTQWEFKSSAALWVVWWTGLTLVTIFLAPILWLRENSSHPGLALVWGAFYFYLAGPRLLWQGLSALPAASNYLRSRNLLGVPLLALVLGAGMPILIDMLFGFFTTGTYVVVPENLAGPVVLGAGVGFLIGWYFGLPNWVTDV